MTIYSWNMLYRNKRLDEAFGFIQSSDFDVFCLQEVPEEFLARLTELPGHRAISTSVERLLDKKETPNYNVILAKHPILFDGVIPFPNYETLLSWRSRFYLRLMPKKLFSMVRNRAGFYADIDVEGTRVRVFNLHLILAQPAWRLKEFELAMVEKEEHVPTIICGDFNTLEKPHITPLNWIFGGDVADVLFYGRERTVIEKRFTEYAFSNPLRGNITHPLSRSQLDHILLSHHFAVQKAAVIPGRHGSDHHPITAAIAFEGDTAQPLLGQK